MQLLFLITLLGVLFPANRVIAWIVIIAMSLFYGGYNGTIDLPNYIWQYENEWKPDFSLQMLYSFLSVYFHNSGISFECYHVMITAISLIVILYITSKLTNQIAYVLSMVSVFVYIENGWQLKTMMATSIIVVALYWFYKRIYIYKREVITKNTYIITFLMLIVLASQFHFLALFFLSFIFIMYIKDHFIRVIIIDLFIFLLSGTILIRISSYIPMIGEYLSQISLPVIIMTVLWQIWGYFILFYNNNIEYIPENRFGFFVKYGTLVLMLIIPFYFYTIVVMRLYKIWLIFMIIYASTLFRKKLIFEKRRLLFDIYIIGSSIFWYYIMFMMNGEETLLYELMSNNFYF